MTDTVDELYAEIEKAKGRGMIPGGSGAAFKRISREQGTMRSRLFGGVGRRNKLQAARASLAERRNGGFRNGKYQGAKRTGVYKSSDTDSIALLYEAVEKAKGMIPRGGSSRLANRLARQGAKLRAKGGDPKASKRFSALGTLENRKKGNSIGLGYTPGKGYKSLMRRGKYK